MPLIDFPVQIHAYTASCLPHPVLVGHLYFLRFILLLVSRAPVPLEGKCTGEEDKPEYAADRNKIEQHASSALEVQVFSTDTAFPSRTMAPFLDRAVCLIVPSLVKVRYVVVKSRSKTAWSHARLGIGAVRSGLRLPLGFMRM